MRIEIRKSSMTERRLRWCAAVMLSLSSIWMTGCYLPGAPKTDDDMYAVHKQISTNPDGTVNHPIPYVDPDFRLAPNDIIGLTFFTRSVPLPEYPLQIGDTLLVEFHQQEHLNRNLVVPPDGMVSIPYLPPVSVAGRTANALSQELTEAYKGTFNNVQITVSLMAFNSRLKELQGVITNSLLGQTREVTVDYDGTASMPMGGNIHLAGLPMAVAKERINDIYRSSLPGADVDVELRGLGFNYLYVLGEVNAPGLVSIPGPMGVLQAIAAAGGAKTGADLKSVAVLRGNSDREAIGRLIDVRRMLNEGDMREDVLIRRFDVVYVPPHTIQKLNDAVLMYIRNMMPFQTQMNTGFTYMWGNTTTGNGFKPF